MIRNSLPNATYIGFTGTPVSTKDRSTREVFGDYIDVYDMTQAVEDGATRPVYYESRVIKLNLDQETLKRIDDEYELMAANADPDVIERSKRQATPFCLFSLMRSRLLCGFEVGHGVFFTVMGLDKTFSELLVVVSPRETDAPHSEQNFESSSICFPQFLQYMTKPPSILRRTPPGCVD